MSPETRNQVQTICQGPNCSRGQGPPGDARADAKDDAFDDPAAVANRAAPAAGTAGQQGFNLVLLLVGQYLVPVSFVAHGASTADRPS